MMRSPAENRRQSSRRNLRSSIAAIRLRTTADGASKAADIPGRGIVSPSARPAAGPTESAGTAQAASASLAQPGAGGGMSILLVEDHLDTRKVMEGLLKRDRHQVAGAATGGEAIQLAEKAKFDLVISDLGLPDMTGIEMMTRLRDQHGLRGIAVSGYGMEEDVARSREAGFVHHLTKPIRLDRLRAVIAELGGASG